jgi:hypothetical protein
MIIAVMRHSKLARVMSAPGSNAELMARKSDFRFTPESGLGADIAPCPKCANSGLSAPRCKAAAAAR